MTDDDFVAAVFTASYRRLVGHMYAVCGDLATAEDVVSEAFVRAIDHMAAFRSADNPEAWLVRVAVNLQRNRWRRLRTHLRLREKLAAPAATVELGPDHVLLMDALARLPETQRTAIVLHHLTDLPVHEVARVQGVAEGTVKARLARGRSALADLLGDDTKEPHV